MGPTSGNRQRHRPLSPRPRNTESSARFAFPLPVVSGLPAESPVACWPIRGGSPDKHLFQCKPDWPIVEVTALRFPPPAGRGGQISRHRRDRVRPPRNTPPVLQWRQGPKAVCPSSALAIIRFWSVSRSRPAPLLREDTGAGHHGKGLLVQDPTGGGEERPVSQRQFGSIHARHSSPRLFDEQFARSDIPHFGGK